MDENVKEIIKKLFDVVKKNTIEVSYNKSKQELKNGRSTFGGKPLLPSGFKWPYYEGEDCTDKVIKRPLAFLASIYLPEVVEYDIDNLLPKIGRLSFFYEMETQRWGYDPKDYGCVKVLYFENDENLLPSEFPHDLDLNYQFPEMFLNFSHKPSLPDYDEFCEAVNENRAYSKQLEEIGDFEWEDYDELKVEYGCSEDKWSEVTKLFGFPDVIQSPMEEECATVTSGLFEVDENIKNLQNTKNQTNEDNNDWILLFQMGMIENDDFELIFGDSGHIYIWIKRDDLAKGNFDKIWLILQCF